MAAINHYENSEKPLVSICCLAYNHEPYIRQCIEGFLMQKTTFPIEILIHDDASTDKTAEIIHEYEVQYPDIIKPIYQKKNQYSKGIGVTRTYQLPRAKGKYIAMCEGDDYWTDPLKLQKQVDFLENNPSFPLVYHNVYFKNEIDNSLKISDWPQKPELNIADLAANNYIYTASVVFRKDKLSSVNIPKNSPFGDYFLWLNIAKHGKIKYMDDPMSVYRIHNGGVWSTLNYFERKKRMLKGKKLLIRYFKNDDIESLLRESYLEQAYTSFIKLLKDKKPFHSVYFLFCIIITPKGLPFLIKKFIRKYL